MEPFHPGKIGRPRGRDPETDISSIRIINTCKASRYIQQRRTLRTSPSHSSPVPEHCPHEAVSFQEQRPCQAQDWRANKCRTLAGNITHDHVWMMRIGTYCFSGISREASTIVCGPSFSSLLFPKRPSCETKEATVGEVCGMR